MFTLDAGTSGNNFAPSSWLAIAINVIYIFVVLAYGLILVSKMCGKDAALLDRNASTSSPASTDNRRQSVSAFVSNLIGTSKHGPLDDVELGLVNKSSKPVVTAPKLKKPQQEQKQKQKQKQEKNPDQAHSHSSGKNKNENEKLANKKLEQEQGKEQEQEQEQEGKTMQQHVIHSDPNRQTADASQPAVDPLIPPQSLGTAPTRSSSGSADVDLEGVALQENNNRSELLSKPSTETSRSRSGSTDYTLALGKGAQDNQKEAEPVEGNAMLDKSSDI